MNIDFKNHILPIGILVILVVLYRFNKDLIGGFIFLTVGGGFLYAGYSVRNSNRRIQSNGIKVKAKIVDFVEEQIKDADGYSHLCHFPIVSFIDRNGIEIQFGKTKLIELQNAIKGIPVGKGDFAIAHQNEEHILYFWWNL